MVEGQEGLYHHPGPLYPGLDRVCPGLDRLCPGHDRRRPGLSRWWPFLPVDCPVDPVHFLVGGLLKSLVPCGDVWQSFWSLKHTWNNKIEHMWIRFYR